MRTSEKLYGFDPQPSPDEPESSNTDDAPLTRKVPAKMAVVTLTRTMLEGFGNEPWRWHATLDDETASGQASTRIGAYEQALDHVCGKSKRGQCGYLVQLTKVTGWTVAVAFAGIENGVVVERGEWRLCK